MIFQYKIRDASGKISTGSEEAPNRNALVKTLQARGFQPIAVMASAAKDSAKAVEKSHGPAVSSVKARKKSFFHLGWGRLVREEEVLMFSRDLLSLIHSGVPVVAGLKDITGQIRNYHFRFVLEEVCEDINGGMKLSEAFEKHPGIFSGFYINSIRAGEQGGRLEEILQRLTQTLTRDLETSLTIKNAVRYPMVVLCFLAAAFALMMTIVVPRFSRMFAKFDTPLPLPTRVIIALGDFFQSYGWAALLAGIGLIVFIQVWKRTREGRLVWDSLKLKLPVFGDLIKKVSLAKFASTLQTLYASGVVLPEALETSSSVVENTAIARSVFKASQVVRQGKVLSDALREDRLFPPLVIRMIMVGEKSGDLENMLGEVVAHYERDIGYMTRSMTTLIEPILTVMLGLMILGFALGVFMPMWNLMKLFRH